MAIVSGLNHSSVQRLKKTWEVISYSNVKLTNLCQFFIIIYIRVYRDVHYQFFMKLKRS